MVDRLVVIGGDAAGMSAASQARRCKAGDQLEIIAFERGPDTSFSACGIPYWIGGFVSGRQALIARTPEVFRDQQQIDVRTRTLVDAIDVAAREVRVTELDTGRQYSEHYDDLVIATGSVPVTPQVPGVEGADVFEVHSLGDGENVRAQLDSGRVVNAVVVGAGYVGLETAEALMARGVTVTLLDHAAAPMASLDPDMSERIAAGIKEAGIGLILGDGLAEVLRDADGRVRAVRTAAGRQLNSELVILALGVQPNVALAKEAGITLGPSGAIAVDRRMSTGTPGVWAAGDCVESRNVLSGKAVTVALGTHANKQGRVAGDNIGGAYAAFPGVLGTAATKVCRTEIARTGLSTREATEAGFAVVSVVTDSTTRAGYYPGANAISVKLIAERGTGRMLGGQIVGHEESAKRIDILATAIWNSMTAQDFFAADLSYAPPYSPVLDPVVIAARKLHDAIRRDLRQERE
ncbi:MAG TPA: FAD-dependent oxidoreductase [Frankiaceae bacterium]|jgi:NADPH-dependent 2,4-dienoyl-CoA reductase/sulfur reductase-like enzyme|nr:FAD-dependent oxidoreductase [Frankiaceae bacterium]